MKYHVAMATSTATAPGNLPPSGRFTVRGPEGEVVVRWVSEGARTDVTLDRIAGPGGTQPFPVADDLLKATATAVAQVAEVQRARGQVVRLFGAGHAEHDEVIADIAELINLDPTDTVQQYRRSLASGLTGAAPASVVDFDDRHLDGLRNLWNGINVVRGTDLAEVILRRQKDFPDHERILVVESHDAEVVAACSVRMRNISPDGPGLGEIAAFVVHEQSRGMGFARQLLRGAEELLEGVGIKTVAAYVGEHDRPAQEFLAHHGFKRRRRIPVYGGAGAF